ncbi:MAG: ACT domain-containing protein [Deltaproteobacteria bacterium]|nr:ACT domain-containing protein [Deltaproteobacteria bacterium]
MSEQKRDDKNMEDKRDMEDKRQSVREMVLVAVGPDAPGRVKAISSFIHEAGGNLEDSRMAMLAGEFALILLFSGNDAVIEDVRRRKSAFERELGFIINLKATVRVSRPDALGYELRVGGVDQPGIVLAVSEVLANLEINVVSLESRVTPAAFSGTPMFTLTASLAVATRPLMATLREELERVCDERNLSYGLEPTDLPRS